MNPKVDVGQSIRFLLLLSVVFFTFSGCVTLDRRQLARDVAHGGGLQANIIKTDFFDIMSYGRFGRTNKALTVYIEGDGMAWINRHTLSKDPTPRDPLALKLAVLDPVANVAYLGRPCQYVESHQRRNCNSSYWSKARFSEEVVVATNQAIEQLKKRANATSINIVGYSGGGGVGMLVAARRNDVDSVRTIAGNLDHAAFTSHHKVTSLTGSLNPIDEVNKLNKIAQLHFVGGKDKIIPTFIADGFVAALGDKSCAQVVVMIGMKHNDSWDKLWLRMLQQSFPECNMVKN
ncbi:MAG: alpha/beta hydrolase [Magnetococcales bacterium]|nr:alpha/beta hydrolase [Magnetococcales bacterium]